MDLSISTADVSSCTNMNANRDSLVDADSLIDESQSSVSILSNSSSASISVSPPRSNPSIRPFKVEVLEAVCRERVVLAKPQVTSYRKPSVSSPTDVEKTLKDELKTELLTRLNPKPNENKRNSIINGRLLLKNIEDQLKDELESVKIPSGFDADRDQSVRPANTPDTRMRKFSYDFGAKPSTKQSRTFMLVKETLDNGEVQKDAVFHDSISKKSSVRRCSLNVPASNYQTSHVVQQVTDDNVPTREIKTTVIKEEVDNFDPIVDKSEEEDFKKYRSTPRSQSLVDDRLMSVPRSKAAYYLNRLSVDFGNDRIQLNEDEEYQVGVDN